MKKGWQKRTLGEVLVKTETTDPTRSPSAEFDYIDVSSVSNAALAVQETQRLKGKDAPSRARRLVRANDVLFATIRPTLRRIAIVPDDLDEQVCSTGYFVLRAKPEMDFRFIFYFLQTETFMAAMEKLQKGASYPAVTDGDVRSQPIPVPPLAEQRRIVGVLDAAFAGLARARAAAATNLQNARALFASHLHAVFSQRGKGWVERRLGEVAEFKNGLNYTRESSGQTLPVVGVGDFQTNSVVPLSQLQTATIDGELSPEYALKCDDILTVRSNGSKDLVGRCMLVPELSETTSYSGFIIRIRVNAAEVLPAFLLHFMKSSDTRERLTRDGGGANISNINQTKLAALLLALPAVAEQKRIVTQLDALAAATQRLAALYERKLAALAALRQALLHQAFAGEL